jgi:hypothetical protein
MCAQPRCCGAANVASIDGPRSTDRWQKGFEMDQVIETEDLFASFDLEELGVLEVTDAVALPQMGASSSTAGFGLCCSSSSSTCCC